MEADESLIKKNALNNKLGEVLLIANHVEAQLDMFISSYFEGKSGNGFLLRWVVLSRVGFKDKRDIFGELCKNHNVSVKGVIKDIEYIADVRNQVAHGQVELIGKDELAIGSKRWNRRNEVILLSDEELRKLDAVRSSVITKIWDAWEKVQSDQADTLNLGSKQSS